MINKKNIAGGFTVIEAVVSMALFILVWAGLAGNIMVGKAIEARSKHSMLAMYTIQQRMETIRRMNFASILNQNINNVTIDDRGTAAVADDLRGTMIVTVRFIPTSVAGNNFLKEVVAQLTWQEIMPGGGTVAATARCGTYFSADPITN